MISHQKLISYAIAIILVVYLIETLLPLVIVGGIAWFLGRWAMKLLA